MFWIYLSYILPALASICFALAFLCFIIAGLSVVNENKGLAKLAAMLMVALLVVGKAIPDTMTARAMAAYGLTGDVLENPKVNSLLEKWVGQGAARQK